MLPRVRARRRRPPACLESQRQPSVSAHQCNYCPLTHKPVQTFVEMCGTLRHLELSLGRAKPPPRAICLFLRRFRACRQLGMGAENPRVLSPPTADPPWWIDAVQSQMLTAVRSAAVRCQLYRRGQAKRRSTFVCASVLRVLARAFAALPCFGHPGLYTEYSAVKKSSTSHSAAAKRLVLPSEPLKSHQADTGCARAVSPH